MSSETQPSTIDYYREKRQELIDKLGGECEECGKKENLHFHHVNPIEIADREGGWQHLYMIMENLENGVEIELRCKQCHIEEHRRRDDLEPLSSYMEEEIA